MVHSIILSSRKNFVWKSMDEIIPSIEKSWNLTKKNNQHSVVLFNIDQVPFSAMLFEILKATNIVLACFTLKMLKLAKIIREINPDARFIIYLHNQVSIACWPYHNWGLSKILKSSDIFISNCERDRDLMGYIYKNSKVIVQPC